MNNVKPKIKVGHLELTLPVAGRICDLEKVPDPVFAQKMMGEGFAIDPDPASRAFCAPVAGTIKMLPATGHAFMVEASDGSTVLVHIGIDTVYLKGQGFTPLVAVGEQVEAGQPVIGVDLQYLGAYAPSLLSPVILLTSK